MSFVSSGRLAKGRHRFLQNKTFSAVLNCRNNRVLYSPAAANKWHLFSSDITQAFTHGKLDAALFCHPPPGFDCPEETVLGLNYFLLELSEPQQASKAS
jgi:hypothetical protein